MDDALESMGASEMGSSPESAPEGPFEMEAATFLDDTLPMPERMSALKEAIRICLDEDKSGGYGGATSNGSNGGGGKGDAGFAFVFGPSKKKS